MNLLIEDGFAVESGTGVGGYTSSLAEAMRQTDDCTVHLQKKKLMKTIPSAAIRRMLYILWLNTGFQLTLRRQRTDLAHFTNYLIPHTRFTDTKYVVTIHDLTALKYPDTLPKLNLLYDRWALSHAFREADLILTVSESVRTEITEMYPSTASRIRVIRNTLPQRYLQMQSSSPGQLPGILRDHGITGDYLLFVGTLEERKNLLTLLDAFREVRNRYDLSLILAGKGAYGYPKILRRIRDLHLGGSVYLPGYVSEEEKLALYDHAGLFVFPSLYEGFGLPLLEAMARNVPVVASDIPSTREVAGECVHYYGDPDDIRGLAETIFAFIENHNLFDRNVIRGRRRAEEFTGRDFGQRYIDAYRSILD